MKTDDAFIDEVLSFWFGDQVETDPLAHAQKWFTKDPSFDHLIKETFEPLVAQVQAGKHKQWCDSARGLMAYIIVTDQFPRNLYRNSKTAFTLDALALEAAQKGVQKKYDQQLHWVFRTFFYLPFEHAEDLSMQEQSLALFQALQKDIPKLYADYGDNVYNYAVKHWEIIKRFGRFPHRSEVLGRTSTEEEKAFLKEPGSSF